MIILFILLAVSLLILLIMLLKGKPFDTQRFFESPQRAAGRRGERRATNIISSVLRDDDFLFSNVNIMYDGRMTELDNVILNKYGVFIIEVKNYNGRLEGSEDDYEWIKYHTTQAGNTYSKTVKNPIKQVKRQVYLLAKYLETNTSQRVWVEGYTILLEGNSPVKSKYVLENVEDIDSAVHSSKRNRLTRENINEIIKLLS